VVALVRGVHGLHGAVRVEVLTDRPEERFVPGAILHREGVPEALTIAAAEAIPDGPGWRLRFDEVPDRTTADALRNAYLEADTDPSDALPIGAYYWHEVVGTSVRDLGDHVIGVVHDVYRVGGAEVFVVRGEPYGEFDLPAVRAFIRIFAPARGEIVVDVEALGLEPAKPPRPPRPPRTPKTRRGGDRTAPAAPVEGSATAGPPSDRAADAPGEAHPSPSAQAAPEPGGG
jgi:16S rRNA processing protein RimM